MPKRAFKPETRCSKKQNAKKRKIRPLTNCETIVIQKSKEHRLLKELFTSPAYRVAVSVPERDVSPDPPSYPAKIKRGRSNCCFWLLCFFCFGVFYLFPFNDVSTPVQPTTPTTSLPAVEENWQIVLPKPEQEPEPEPEPEKEREACFFLSESQLYQDQNSSLQPAYVVVCITL